MRNDLSLLRPFNQKAAQQDGEPICDMNGCEVWDLKLVDAVGIVCVSHKQTNIAYLRESSSLRMAPLGWVEGKPVYRGDLLWRKTVAPYSVRITGLNHRALGYKGIVETSSAPYAVVGTEVWYPFSLWTWAPWTPPAEAPKNEAYINFYGLKGPAFPYPTQEEADDAARKENGEISSDRIACIKFTW